MVVTDLLEAACAARKRTAFHAMGSKTIQRRLAFPLVFSSYKLLEIERSGFVPVRASEDSARVSPGLLAALLGIPCKASRVPYDGLCDVG